MSDSESEANFLECNLTEILEKTKKEWISIQKLLPGIGKMVLLKQTSKQDDSYIIQCATLMESEDGFIFDIGNGLKSSHYITHWCFYELDKFERGKT